MDENSDRPRVFKGMPRRVFRYTDPDALVADARKSPYYWWWKYLRLSKDYWLVCVRHGVADDPRLKSMYLDFHDVFTASFDEWWGRRGVVLFAERVALPAVRSIDPDDMRLSRDTDQHLLLELPLHLTERTLISQVRKLLREHPNREIKRRSSALRPLAQLKGIRQDVIETAHAVAQSHYLSRDTTREYKSGQVQGTKSLYQIGKELRLVRTCMPAVTDGPERTREKVNGMKVAVARMLARASNLTEQAAVGVFPSAQKLSEPVQWKAGPQRALQRAVDEGYWRPLFEDSDTLSIQRMPHPFARPVVSNDS